MAHSYSTFNLQLTLFVKNVERTQQGDQHDTISELNSLNPLESSPPLPFSLPNHNELIKHIGTAETVKILCS